MLSMDSEWLWSFNVGRPSAVRNLVGDVDNGTDYTSVGAKGMWEISVPSPQFSSEL